MRPIILILAVMSISVSAERLYATDLLTDTKSAIQEWVRTEQLVSQENQQWEEEKASLNSILKILSAEEQELGEQIALAQEVASRADEERASLVEQLSSYQEISQLLESRITDYERQLVLIVAYLPQMLRSELAPRIARLNSATQGSSPSLSERTQTLLSLMSEIDTFDGRLTLTTELISNSQNEPVEVRVLYLGLSRAFYVNNNATSAGFGVPTETGWQWQAQDELSETIARSLDIYETRITPQLISLPMQVQR